MAQPARFTFPAGTTTSICSAQTTAGAGSFVIDGPLVDTASITAGGPRRVILPGIQRVVSLTSAANISAVNFTITGFDSRGVAVSETRAGPNINTVETAQEFAIVTSVTVNAAVGTGTSVGTGTTGTTRWWTNNLNIAPANLALYVAITGTINYTVQDTPDNANDVTITPVAFPHPTLAALTANGNSNYAYPPRYVRLKINSSTIGATADFTINPAGIAGN